MLYPTGFPVRPHTNICVGSFASPSAAGKVSGLEQDDVVIAVNGSDMLGKELTVFQTLVADLQRKNETLRFALYRDGKSAKPLVNKQVGV